jgi:glutamyl-tRNA reductase
MTNRGTHKNNFAPLMTQFQQAHNFLKDFCVAGINYKKSDISVRGKFSLLPEQSSFLIQQASDKGLPGCMVLSTCNRTEVYAVSDQPHELVELLCTHTQGSIKDFAEQGYQYRGLMAIEHMFRVAAGLDSQIIGDYEILSQLKQAAKQAKEQKGLNSFMERVVNFALKSSKEIKTRTKLSSGTVSVSYAAIEIIRERITDPDQKKIFLVGTGKFGAQIGKNLKSYLPNTKLSFANRTDEKAITLAETCDAKFVPFKNLVKEANNADIIIVSSAAENYTIIPEYFSSAKPRLILDLSVPQNVDPGVKNLKSITLLNVDEISSKLDNTIALRKAEIPFAVDIINDNMKDLCDWYRKQANGPILKAVKNQLYELSEIHLPNQNWDDKIHKTVSSLAIQLDHQKNRGCQCISALSSYLHMN